MSQRLKNLYTYLIQNRKHELVGWYNEYKKFTSDIAKIRTKLNENYDLKDKETYTETSFRESDNPYDEFISKLLYDQTNGISSRGQSVLSWENLTKFKQVSDFDEKIRNLIVSHDFDSFKMFREWWIKQNVGNNPVLINRAIAACTTKVSTTADEGKFNQVFFWLQKEGLIEYYPDNKPQDWYSKNIYAIEQLNNGLEGTPDVDEYWIGLCVWEMYVNISNPFSLKKQIVKYGAPGTGKTFTAKQNSTLLFDIWKDEFLPNQQIDFNEHIEIVQFHPSYTYEDFIEGLRPKLDTENQAQLVLQNGVFKDFCKKAARWESDIYLLQSEVYEVKSWYDLTINDIIDFQPKLNSEHWTYIFNIEDKRKKLADAVPPYFFIIDEINRAELSRVFGELMYCLEYRGINGSIKTQYANLNDENTGMIKIGDSYQFYIPNNLYLIGTMNTIDRSVESFDFALRRRFRWEEVFPDITLLQYHLLNHNKNWIGLAENLKNLNLSIKSEPLLGRDFQIGHAYFWSLPYSKDLTLSEVRKAIWEDSIEPLLQEYIRGTGREDLLNIFANKFGIR
ncbi:AAA family ATPase [Draconibacterium orientale]|uniref:McrB family protein n=1 Tax=Draconibacterium orientale TaxID=1168034 RepID=UPI002A0A77DC|nr:AAA family ATPase [Draconibacterium orientale]